MTAWIKNEASTQKYKTRSFIRLYIETQLAVSTARDFGPNRLLFKAAEERAGFARPEALHVLEAGVS